VAMNLIVSKNPEDHAPDAARGINDVIRPLGDHRFIVLEPAEQIGTTELRYGTLIRVSRKTTIPQGIVEGVELSGWITLSVLTMSSNRIQLSSNSTSSKSELVILNGKSEMRAYFDANTDYFKLSIHESLLLPDVALGIIDPRFLSVNASYVIAEHQRFAFAKMLSRLLYTRYSDLEFETLTTDLAIMMLAVLSKSRAPTPINNRRRCVKKATELISSNSVDKITLVDLARNCHCSLRTLDYAFTSILGVTPSHYLEMYRLNNLRQSLLQGDKKVGEAAFDLGYKHLGNLAKSYTDLFGELPSITRAKVLPTC